MDLKKKYYFNLIMVNSGVPHTLPSPGNPPRTLVGPSLATVTQFIFPPPAFGD